MQNAARAGGVGTIVLIALVYLLGGEVDQLFGSSSSSAGSDGEPIHDAYAQGKSDVLVRGTGRVKVLLSDDTKGSQHQRFIMEVGNGQTVLVAHNIDLAPRLDELKVGDRVEYQGEYEWNEKGGVLHWTHHDPAGRHPGGYLVHKGMKYE